MRRRIGTQALGVLGVVLLSVLAVPVATPSTAAAQSTIGLPTLAPDEFVALLDRAELPGTTPPGPVPAVTGFGAADYRIVALARATDYRQRRQAAVPLSGASGVPLNPEATDAMVRMAGAARAAGAPFTPVSGYRSVDDQRQIFLSQLAQRGSGRIGRPYSVFEVASGAADGAINDVLRLNSIPGFSFHHSGNTADLVAPGGSLGGFVSSNAYRWLSGDNYANAKSFGFLPSYPVGAGAIGPEPEPWEFTYVGLRQLRCARNVVALAAPSPGRCPVGSLDLVSATGTRVSVAGWAADADVGGAAIAVHVYADGRGVAVIQADGSRPDVDAATGLGANHGLGATVELGPGDHEVCAYAINDGAGEENTLLGCRVVAVRTTPPVGAVDRLVASGSGAFVEGWTADPDLPAAVLDIHVYVDGVGVAVTPAGGFRPDVDAATGFGPAHGFATPVPMTGGVHQVCVYAITPQPAEGNRLLACQLVWALGSSPAGVVDAATGDCCVGGGGGLGGGR